MFSSTVKLSQDDVGQSLSWGNQSSHWARSGGKRGTFGAEYNNSHSAIARDAASRLARIVQAYFCRSQGESGATRHLIWQL